MRRFLRIQTAISVVLHLCASVAFAAPDGVLEESVCGSFKEWLAFSLWVGAAGSPNSGAASSLQNVSSISYKTVDGRTLRGFRVAASGKARGALLIAQGNAMLADQLVRPLNVIAGDGVDVFVFDYRGYGLSEGIPRLKAIVNDYRELAKEVSRITPGKLYLYGMSFGGVVLLHANATLDTVDALVIDSSPSAVSDMGCPPEYDPISNVPQSAAHILMVIGEKDRVVPPSSSLALADMVRSRGGRIERREQFAHPFMDVDPQVRSTRLRLVADFFNTK